MAEGGAARAVERVEHRHNWSLKRNLFVQMAAHCLEDLSTVVCL